MNVASFMLLAKFMLTYLPWVRARKLWFDHPCHVAHVGESLRDCGLLAHAWLPMRRPESYEEMSVRKLPVCHKTPWWA